MVHALYEAHRVLKPDGILIDLRPALKHRHAGLVLSPADGLGHGSDFKSLGVMREDFTDDRAANRAVAHVVREGLFRRESRAEFDLDPMMDSLDDLREWLDDLCSQDKTPSHAWLVERLEQAVVRAGPGSRITVRGPLMLAVLRKLDNGD
jgi:SAM-dependent methyltransferase